jgi:hypothetical protein
LMFTKKPGNKFDHKGTITYVPKGFKLLKIHTDSYFPLPYDCNITESARKKKQQEQREEELRIKQGKPGKLYHVNALLNTQGVHPMSLHTNGSEYFATIGAAKKKYKDPVSAKIGMVLDVGFSEKNAEELISSLLPDVAVTGYVKLAVTGDYTLPLMQMSLVNQPTQVTHTK